MCAVITAAILIFTAYMLFRPASYYASAGWDIIEVQPVSESAAAFAITDKAMVEAVVDLLNSADFRKSLHRSNEAPDHLQAVFYARDEDGAGAAADIWLCSAANDKVSLYIWNGTEEFVACHAEKPGEYMAQLIENQQICDPNLNVRRKQAP